MAKYTLPLYNTEDSEQAISRVVCTHEQVRHAHGWEKWLQRLWGRE